MLVNTGQNPKFSILLPTHNRADVLPFAICSVLGQTVQDFELLIAGDGCTDKTAEVVKNLAEPRLHWFDLPKAPNFGYANRNIALRQARGLYIAYMTHDDLWLPDHLELLSNFLEEARSELIYSRPIWIAPDGTITPSTFNLHHAEARDLFLDRRQNAIPSSCVLHRRDCFDKYGYWDETLTGGGDWDMWVRIIEGGNRQNFAYLELPTCLHFRAIWRTEANAGPPELKVWRELHALEDFVPPTLQIPIPAGLTEQEVFWQAIQTNPTNWTQELRRAIHQVLDQRVFHSDQLLLEIFKHLKSRDIKNLSAKSLITLTTSEFENFQLLKTEVQQLAAEIAEIQGMQQPLRAEYEKTADYARSLEIFLQAYKTQVGHTQALEENYLQLQQVYAEAREYIKTLETNLQVQAEELRSTKVTVQQQIARLSSLQLELDAIHGSRAWQLANKIRQLHLWLRRFL